MYISIVVVVSAVNQILTPNAPVYNRAKPCPAFCVILSPSGALSDNAPLLLTGFS